MAKKSAKKKSTPAVKPARQASTAKSNAKASAGKNGPAKNAAPKNAAPKNSVAKRALGKSLLPQQSNVESPNAASAGALIYVGIWTEPVTVSRAKPVPGRGAHACDAWENARSTAIDALLATIERAEQQLAATKRATTLDELLACFAAE